MERGKALDRGGREGFAKDAKKGLIPEAASGSSCACVVVKRGLLGSAFVRGREPEPGLS